MPSLITLTSKLKDLSTDWANIPMLARTHGQPPLRWEEIAVFVAFRRANAFVIQYSVCSQWSNRKL
jgi:hypothetical protein